MSDKPVCFAGIKKLPVEVLHVTPVLLELSATLRVIITHTYFHMEMITVFFFPLTVLIFRCTLLSNNNQRQTFFFPIFFFLK